MKRNLLFAILFLILLLVFCEGLAFLGFSCVDSHWLTWQELHRQQPACIAALSQEDLPHGDRSAEIHQLIIVKDSFLHPYMGYVILGRESERFEFGNPINPVQKRTHDELIIGIFGDAVFFASSVAVQFHRSSGMVGDGPVL